MAQSDACGECGATFPQGVDFCSYCGSARPAPEPEPIKWPESSPTPAPEVPARRRRGRSWALVGLLLVGILFVVSLVLNRAGPAATVTIEDYGQAWKAVGRSEKRDICRNFVKRRDDLWNAVSGANQGLPKKDWQQFTKQKCGTTLAQVTKRYGQ